jgi:GTP-binding protein EngB required for normal cell division
MTSSAEERALQWFDQQAKPFLEAHAPEKLASLQSDYDRLMRLMARPEDVTVCFLGNSGVGKSTLLNALAADDAQVLPAGGIGPLTAQATEVHYSDEPMFRVTYHGKDRLWKVAFAIETRLDRQKKIAAGKPHGTSGVSSDLAAELSEVDQQEAISDATLIESPAEDAAIADSLEGFIKQAKNIVCGNQFADRSLEYLVDGLRVACGLEAKWGQQPDADDAHRLARVRRIMTAAKAARHYERLSKNDHRDFMEDLKAHAAGFLSPLIERIEVGWPADVLRAGVKLVDLPGIGIAQDSYRDVTKSYVREKARAVIVVVDRAGPTESTVELLRTSGYWDRLVGAADDPLSDSCTMLIAVTKVDDVANTEWSDRVSKLESGQTKPRKREVFMELVEEFKPRMRAQIAAQLGNINDSTNEAINTARQQARQNILDSLEIHPVSAPEMRRLILDDEDDPSFLNDLVQTGIPQLRDSLSRLAQGERNFRATQIKEIRSRLLSSTLNELHVIQASWQEDNRAAEEAERLEKALENFINPKKEEYRARAAEFRGYLKETVQARIETLVMEARDEAEKEVRQYLARLRNAHWATLRAAVRRGGTFYGSSHINLPDDISGYFQEPMAAVWGQKLLRDIRKRTTELANDIEQMVTEVCDWAKLEAGAHVNKKLLDSQQARIAGLAAQMKAVGKEAVDEMRETVKIELTKTIRSPIKSSCEKFVREGDDIGSGVKYRILELFERLAREATTAARDPATRILAEKATVVRQDIQREFKNGGDPLQDTADLIVQRHEDRLRRSDAQKRKAVLSQVDTALQTYPDSQNEAASSRT